MVGENHSCSNCGNWVYADQSVCPVCGAVQPGWEQSNSILGFDTVPQTSSSWNSPSGFQQWDQQSTEPLNNITETQHVNARGRSVDSDPDYVPPKKHYHGCGCFIFILGIIAIIALLIIGIVNVTAAERVDEVYDTDSSYEIVLEDNLDE